MAPPSPEDALRDADAAMYGAKARGRMCAEIAGGELVPAGTRSIDNG